MQTKEVKLAVDLSGLVRIFGDALYQDFGSVVRELVQNAHDAVIEECAQHTDPTEEVVRDHSISVLFDSSRHLLVVADDGKGMTAAAMSENLNNFARSKKRDIEKEVGASAKTDAARRLLHIVGEYGVGFLSAMAISDDVEVWSKTTTTEPIVWRYSSGQDAARLQSENEAAFEAILKTHLQKPRTEGTIVICNLKSTVLEEYGIDEDNVRTSLVQYATLLPVPIHYNEEGISCKYPAWENPMAASEEDWCQAICGMHNEEPLLVIPIFSPPEELDVQGVLWMPKRTFFFSKPKLDVYVKRMFVVRDDGIIIPSWARFVSGMINSNHLRRIVSGNTVKNDAVAKRTRDFLKNRVVEEFQKLRRRPDPEYWRIVAPHDSEIKGSAADDDEFRACVWDKVRFTCRDRKLTIPDYLSQVKRKTGKDNTIYFYSEKKQQHSADLVAEATGVLIMDIDQTRDDLIVRKICKERNIDLRSFRELAEEHFKKPDEDDAMTSLIAACAQLNIDAEVRSYSPHYLPAILIEDQTFSDRRDQLLKGLKEHGEKHFARDLEKLFVKQRAANFGVSFYLNLENPLIKTLSVSDFDDQARICLALYNISFMAAVPNLRDAERRTIYESIAAVFASALQKKPASPCVSGEVEAVTPPNLDRPHGPVKVFMITPFADEYRKIEEAVRKVFEQAPYFFQVLLARDYTYHSSLLRNVQTHIDQSDAFLAETTDLNPNVMLELGAVLLAVNDKPVFSLRGRDAKKDVPADLKSELYIPYGALTDPVEDIVSEIRAALEKDGRPIHAGVQGLLKKQTEKAMTKTVLEGLAYRLQDGELKAILREFNSIEKFLSAERTAVAQTTGLKVYVIDALRGQLQELVEGASKAKLHRMF